MVVTLDLRSTVELTDDRFEQICQSNRDLKFERTAIGELVVVALTGGETGRRNIKLSARLEIWNEQSEMGVAFDSSTGFRLPNGAIRSPDAAWIRLDRWEALTPEQRRKLVPLCPDFVVELRSPSDEIAEIQAKMREYQENGLRLGWLLDPETQRVEIYRSDSSAPRVRTVEILENPTQLSGEDVLPGFSLNLMGILGD
jgi:Uma2 family endonuclease